MSVRNVILKVPHTFCSLLQPIYGLMMIKEGLALAYEHRTIKELILIKELPHRFWAPLFAVPFVPSPTCKGAS